MHLNKVGETVSNTPNNLAEEVLMHHGILGMKWGIRRYQNKDGSLTAAGRKHIAKDAKSFYKKSKEVKDFRKKLRADAQIKANFDYMSKKEAYRITGIKSKDLPKYLNSKNEKKRQRAQLYLNVANNQMKELKSSDVYKEKEKELIKSSEIASKEIKKFIDNYLKDSGDTPVRQFDPNSETRRIMAETFNKWANVKPIEVRGY